MARRPRARITVWCTQSFRYDQVPTAIPRRRYQRRTAAEKISSFDTSKHKTDETHIRTSISSQGSFSKLTRLEWDRAARRTQTV
eukprot:4090386-Pleurochrysis_carterae.AAC.1